MKFIPTHVVSKVLSTGLLVSVLMGCGSARETSETKVTNGVSIAESSYPSVVRLITYLNAAKTSTFTCTGTFLNDSQVLTAGHCVERALQGHPVYIQDRSNGVKNDIAQAISFVRHPNYDIAKAVSQLAPQSPKAGDKLTIVGFGNNVNTLVNGRMSGSGGGPKRVGYNSVVKVEEGFIHFYGSLSANSQTPEGADAASGAGDSGGPLFINGKVAGVTSGGTIAQEKNGELFTYSPYVDLNSASSQKFLASAVKH